MAEETPSKEWLDKERLLVERYRIKQETQRHSAEMVLRELELKQEAERLELDRQQVRSSRDPLIIGVIAAAFGLLANALVASITAWKEREISSSNAAEERIALKFNADEQLKQTIRNNQAQRILEALKTEGDTDKAVENLKLLAEAGLVQDFAEGISAYVTSLDERRIETQNPTLGPGTATSGSSTFEDISTPKSNQPTNRIIIDERELDALARVSQSEHGHFVKYGEDELRKGILGIVDIILNRVAHVRFPSNVFEVVDQPFQFSAINNLGSWDALPTATPEIRALIHEYLRKRAQGVPSTTTATHFLNPHLSSVSALTQWGNYVVENATLDAGSKEEQDVAYFGRAPGISEPRQYAVWYDGISLSSEELGLVNTGDALVNSIVRVTNEELRHFGNGQFKEDDEGQWARVGIYWSVLGLPYHGRSKVTLGDGSTTNPSWSAAFIGYVLKEAGAVERFTPSQANWSYFNQFLPEQKNSLYVALPATEVAPQPGDLIIYGRDWASGFDYEAAKQHVLQDGFFPSHADIVTSVDPSQNSIRVVGGNVSNSVAEKSIPIDDQGKLFPRDAGVGPEKPWISVIQLQK